MIGTQLDMQALATAELAGRQDLIPALEEAVGDVPRCGCGSKAVGYHGTPLNPKLRDPERDGKLFCYRCGAIRSGEESR